MSIDVQYYLLSQTSRHPELKVDLPVDASFLECYAPDLLTFRHDHLLHGYIGFVGVLSDWVSFQE